MILEYGWDILRCCIAPRGLGGLGTAGLGIIGAKGVATVHGSITAYYK
jgi:hypothetical protein